MTNAPTREGLPELPEAPHSADLPGGVDPEDYEDAPPPPSDAAQGEWTEAERIACHDDVDDALRDFAADSTGDNGTMVIREVLRYLRKQSQPVRVDELEQEWADAYAAFKGAFDTPAERRRRGDEYATDARERLRKFDELMETLAAHKGEGNG